MISAHPTLLSSEKSEDDTKAGEENDGNGDDEDNKPSLELQGAVIECLGKSWPANSQQTQAGYVFCRHRIPNFSISRMVNFKTNGFQEGQ